MKAIIYDRMVQRLKDGKEIECYEVIGLYLGVYLVKIVYFDGEEELVEGDLEWFNSRFYIEEVVLYK